MQNTQTGGPGLTPTLGVSPRREVSQEKAGSQASISDVRQTSAPLSTQSLTPILKHASNLGTGAQQVQVESGGPHHGTGSSSEVAEGPKSGSPANLSLDNAKLDTAAGAQLVVIPTPSTMQLSDEPLLEQRDPSEQLNGSGQSLGSEEVLITGDAPICRDEVDHKHHGHDQPIRNLLRESQPLSELMVCTSEGDYRRVLASLMERYDRERLYEEV